MDEKGMELVREFIELDPEKTQVVCQRFGVTFDKNNPQLITALEHLCDYDYFRLKRVENEIVVQFLK
ncbi:MAG TPA: hypothetical protein VGO63_02680 [Candidatus Paceibacterota bacterium]|jgi:hypothetical protein|nr:hypothetical protein [Candidatus Paceibacterota bacterium]